MNIYRPHSPTGLLILQLRAIAHRARLLNTVLFYWTRHLSGFASYLRCNFGTNIRGYTYIRAHIFEFNGVGIFVEFLFFFLIFKRIFYSVFYTGRARARFLSSSWPLPHHLRHRHRHRRRDQWHTAHVVVFVVAQNITRCTSLTRIDKKKKKRNEQL